MAQGEIPALRGNMKAARWQKNSLSIAKTYATSYLTKGNGGSKISYYELDSYRPGAGLHLTSNLFCSIAFTTSLVHSSDTLT
jgi:hypothetical protein